ncbi:Phage terminase large subunit (XtmB) [Fructobacillus cardui]|uniref:PBSX family phage terminase large subunit n=1 Tax=Fructobacillus cardui TaxID=2893170 RepID=UPI002DA4D1AE|nr:Phage terminase large subunit (XtmB) [Fructobacillus cardui]
MRMMMKGNLAHIYTDKQIEAIKAYTNEDFKIMILSGAVRTGKTVVDNDIFLMELLRVSDQAKREHIDEPIYILGGVSSKTIANNVLNPIENRLHLPINFDKNGSFKLFGVKVVLAYTGTERGVGSIRGLTAYGAYVNEASLAVENVFNEINQRVSKPNGRIICDTNPDSPSHWLKQKYIDKAGDEDVRIRVINFKLDDNRKFLSEDYIKQLKASYGSGALYDRAILGLWTSAEGAVYADWYDNENYIERADLPQMKRYIAGVDWGYRHYGSIVVIGVGIDDRYYLVYEHSRQLKPISYWVEVGKEVKSLFGRDIPFICDTARTEHIDAFSDAGLNAQYADKKVEEGIEIMASLIKRREFLCVRDVLTSRDQSGNSVSIFEDNIHGYVWDDKTGKVVKDHDDSLDAIRYVIKDIMNNKNIKSVTQMLFS